MKRLLILLVAVVFAVSGAVGVSAEKGESRGEEDNKAQCKAEARDGSFGCWVKCDDGESASCEAGDDYSTSNCTCHDWQSDNQD